MASSVTYQIWIDDQGDYTLIPRSNAEDYRGRGLLGPNTRLVSTFEAATWEEAVAYYEATFSTNGSSCRPST